MSLHGLGVICQAKDCVKNRWGECRREYISELEPGVVIVTCASYKRDDGLKARIEAREAREDYRHMVQVGEYQ